MRHILKSTFSQIDIEIFFFNTNLCVLNGMDVMSCNLKWLFLTLLCCYLLTDTVTDTSLVAVVQFLPSASKMLSII